VTTESPCLKICVMDPVRGLCRGCGRTLDEIAAWASLAPAERTAIMALLPARLRAAGLPLPSAPSTSS